jgi:hypothetical protein
MSSEVTGFCYALSFGRFDGLLPSASVVTALILGTPAPLLPSASVVTALILGTPAPLLPSASVVTALILGTPAPLLPSASTTPEPNNTVAEIKPINIDLRMSFSNRCLSSEAAVVRLYTQHKRRRKEKPITVIA